MVFLLNKLLKDKHHYHCMINEEITKQNKTKNMNRLYVRVELVPRTTTEIIITEQNINHTTNKKVE
jgi:hypothetical protein